MKSISKYFVLLCYLLLGVNKLSHAHDCKVKRFADLLEVLSELFDERFYIRNHTERHISKENRCGAHFPKITPMDVHKNDGKSVKVSDRQSNISLINVTSSFIIWLGKNYIYGYTTRRFSL